MGGTKDYIPSGGFTEQKYHQIGTTANGIKVIEKIEGNNKLPRFSNTKDTKYARLDDGGKVNQIAFYGGKDGRTILKTIDYGHGHRNKETNGMRFTRKDVHVHEFIDGKRRDDDHARKPSKKEFRMFMLARNGKITR